MDHDGIEVKRMYSADDRRSMADDGTALPDGSFPIADADDVRNAIAAFGRAKDPRAAKVHIIKRATELGHEDLIPQSWTTRATEKGAEDIYEEQAKQAMDEDLEDVETPEENAAGEDEPDPEKIRMIEQRMMKAGAALPEDDAEAPMPSLAPRPRPMAAAMPEGDLEDEMPEGADTEMAEDDEYDEEMPPSRRRPMPVEPTLQKAVVKIGADGAVMKCAKGLAGTACGYKAGAKVCGKCGAMAVETKTTEVARLDIEDPNERLAVRRTYLEDLGTKSADVTEGAYTCMLEQKVLPGSTAPCAGCTGGCLSTEGLPDLAEMEAVAAQLFGKVLDSGYSDAADRFLVTVERKDGLYEAHFDGQGGFQALIRLPEDMLLDTPVVTADEAITAALGEVEGKALAIDAAILEGYEVYSIEVEGTDGKSYDVYVDPVSGGVLAYDAYELSAAEVEATAVKSDDSEFTAAMMEFELLEVELDAPLDES